jgi:HAD superfamily hydrolase (TIGR01509 family)
MISGEEGRLKPNADFFETFLSKFALHADESLFIDDEKANVDGAKSLGFHTIHFQNNPTNYTEMRSLLLLKEQA